MSHEAMTAEPAEQALEEALKDAWGETRTVLQNGLRRGVNATPVCVAVLGWLCEMPTEPAIAEIRRTPEGRVWVRLSDEARMEPLCPFPEFLTQIRIICAALTLTEAQTQQVILHTRQRLG